MEEKTYTKEQLTDAMGFAFSEGMFWAEIYSGHFTPTEVTNRDKLDKCVNEFFKILDGTDDLPKEIEPLIRISLGYASSYLDWDVFCEILGLNRYCLNEGANSDTEYYLTLSDARRCGIGSVTDEQVIR